MTLTLRNTSMNNLKDKTKILLDVRKQIDKLKEDFEKEMEPLKATKEAVQESILADMKMGGQYSARFDFATITMAVRRTPRVVDENAVIKVLKRMKLDKEYVKPRLIDAFQKALPQLLEAHEEINGVEIKETEFLSVRSADEEKEKRKVVTE